MMPSKAEFLANWTSLTDSRLVDCYVSVRPHGKGRAKQVLELDPVGIKLKLCQEAEQAGFLEALALAVANWEDLAQRPPEDILAMMTTVCGDYGVLQGITDQQKGFMNARILLPLVNVSLASAIVYANEPNRKQIGTAFLVKPDLVLTAAHVAMQIVEAQNGSYWTDTLRPNLEFEFPPRINDQGGASMVVRPASAKPLRYALPHAVPPDKLDLSGAPQAATNLDYALIRLAQRVDHVDPVEINDSASVTVGRSCWAFGYPKGTALMMDVDLVAHVDTEAGRWRHRANTDAGMSGGCCVNDEGEVAGIHEGTLQLPVEGKQKRFNRGISIAAIRNHQRQNGTDPFNERSKTEGLEFGDADTVRELYQSVLELAPEAKREPWRAQVVAALGQDPDTPGTLPSFHPWFRRDAVELWIDSRDTAARLCMVHGERGAGSSFTARILRTKLATNGGDLLALNATQTRAIGWEDAISHALGAEDSSYRTAAAMARYSDTEALINELRNRSVSRRRTRYVALDFGHPDPAFRFEGSPWMDLVCTLLQNDWIKVLLIGLGQADRDALISRLDDSPLTDAIGPIEAEMTHIDRRQFISYARSLAKARGVARTPSELEAFATEKLVDFAGSDSAALQTAAAALTAIVFERSLK